MFTFKDFKYKNILNIKNLHIDPQSLTFITGESGSGKTTLLNILQGMDYDYEGTLTLDKVEIKGQNSQELRSKIGRLSQNIVFHKSTIEEEFQYIGKLLKINPTKEQMEEVLNIANLNVPLNKEIINLSGGEKQRLALSRLLLTEKRILLLDEITSALDHENAKIILRNLQNYSQSKNLKLIIVSHDQNLINNFSTDTITLIKGGLYDR